MPPTVRGADADRLERSCGRRSDSIRFGPSAYGVERAEVYMSTRGFDSATALTAASSDGYEAAVVSAIQRPGVKP